VTAGGTAEVAPHDSYSSVVRPSAASLRINPENSFVNDPASPVQWPFAVGVHIGSDFGPRPGCSIGCSTNHLGQDFNPGYGAVIQAVADGVVVESTDQGGAFGVKVVIAHIVDGKRVESLYAHMVPGSRLVQVGDPVSAGQNIGRTGNSGRSTGPHLHLEITEDGRKVDPLEWLIANTA
jgi:murein DD-endopeptidase MepM/ murein hydrolase activator NlpD